MSLSREEIETVVNDFDKIATKSESKSTPKTNNTKILTISIVLILLAAAGGYYLYTKSKKPAAAPVEVVPPTSN